MNLQSFDLGGERPLDPPENPRRDALWEQALELARKQAADASRTGAWFNDYIDDEGCAAIGAAWAANDWTILARWIEDTIELDATQARAPEILRELESER